MRLRATITTTAFSLAAVAAIATPSAHADNAPSLTGTWTASDGSRAKVFTDGGACTNAFYNEGKPLDIGGPMSCQLSSSADASGRYKLMVTQGPNQAIYLVQFHGNDSADVLNPNGSLLYSIKRF